MRRGALRSYRLAGLPAGEYTVRCELPNYLIPDAEPRHVTVVDRGCAEVSFITQSDGRVRGKVVGQTHTGAIPPPEKPAAPAPPAAAPPAAPVPATKPPASPEP